MAKQDSSCVIISRQEAIARGLKHYFTGRPCKRGHLSIRHVDYCKCYQCNREDWKADYAVNRDKRVQSERRRRKKNRAHILNLERGRYHKNPDKFRAKTRKRYQKNKEEIKRKRREKHHQTYAGSAEREAAIKRVREWAKNNPEHAKRLQQVGKHKRRAREKKAGGSFTADDVSRILKQQKGKCAFCRAVLGLKYHVDHIVPLSKGGTNHARNLQALCEPCNLSKGARDPIDHMRSLGMLL